MYRSRAKRGWQMQEMFTWKQFIWVFIVLERKLNFCVITEIMVTDTQKCRRTNRQRKRPWRSRQRVSLIILRSWVRASLVAVQGETFYLLYIQLYNFTKKKEKLQTKSIAFRTEINFVRLIKLIYKKYQIVPQSCKKRVTNARDVHMKTVHLSVFSFGKKTKFLCDHQNHGNRHRKE